MQPTDVLAMQVLGQCGGLLPSPFLMLCSQELPQYFLPSSFSSCLPAARMQSRRGLCRKGSPDLLLQQPGHRPSEAPRWLQQDLDTARSCQKA